MDGVGVAVREPKVRSDHEGIVKASDYLHVVAQPLTE